MPDPCDEAFADSFVQLLDKSRRDLNNFFNRFPMNHQPNHPSPAPVATLPHGFNNAFRFSAFNALSFQIVLASPMILYAKSLGASATVLGIIAGMMPLLVIFQIPAASHINRIGYRRFVLAGWSTRVAFIFLMALVPLAGAFLNQSNRLALLLALLFCFNLARGISSCAWLPWITLLVPAELRGKYLARDAAVQNLASFGTFLLSAATLAGTTQPWQFAVLFAFSAAMGAVSLLFLKKIPDVPTPRETSPSTASVPWLEMARYAPFAKLLRTVVVWSVAYGGITAFTVAFLKTHSGLSEGKILLISSTAFLGGVSTLWLMHSRFDRVGSKPVLGAACGGWLIVLTGWVLLAGGVVEASLGLIVGLQFFMGLLAALANMANNRLAMAIVPPMGRNHFFAIYSVVTNVTLGLAPIAWGVLIDAIGNRAPQWLGLEWNRFTVFFAAVAVVFALTFLVSRRLDEPKAASLEELLREILIQSPQKFWLRFWPRG
ncbi:MAG: MFS transporter [Pedosphaera sp.]|nr:MFS transporter [Pedosphaera sp.]